MLKKLMAMGLVMLLLIGCAQAFALDETEGVTFNPSTNEITVTLIENGTTGYVWALKGLDGQSTLTLTEDRTEALPGTEGLTGAPVRRVWVFSVGQMGAVTLTFSYQRPWEENAPVDERTLTVTLGEQGALQYAMSAWLSSEASDQ